MIKRVVRGAARRMREPAGTCPVPKEDAFVGTISTSAPARTAARARSSKKTS